MQTRNLVPAMPGSRFGKRLGVLAMLCALTASGCSNGICCLSNHSLTGHCGSLSCWPRIDPTGDHIFLHGNSAPPPLAPVIVGPVVPPPGTAPIVTPPPVVTPGLPAAGVAIPPALPPDGAAAALVPPSGVSMTPTQVVASVGSEVLMIATVVGQNGTMLSGERVEWTIAQGGVGQFISPGRRGGLDFIDMLRGLPQKVNNTYVVNSTVTLNTTVDRGTPNPADDVPIRSGQAWVTVSSPVEGNTFVSAYAPNVKGWDQRQQTGTIYWVDAQWSFPPPANIPVGARHSFTTTLTRQTDASPLAGYVVRYEIAGGPDAGFSPDGSSAIEIVTGETGQATAEIFQKAATAGSNTVSIQVVRPAGAGGPSRRVVLGTDSALATWTAADLTVRTAADLTVRTSGPAQAAVGAIATYRIEVTNPTPTAMQGVVVTDQAPAGLTFLNSNPAAGNAAGGQEWQIDDLGPQQSRVIEVNFRVEQPGSLSYCASVTGAAGQTARGCATTMVAAAAAAGTAPATPPTTPPAASQGGQFDVAVKGPAAAEVGTDASFTLEVTNRGATAATGVLISDRFDAGLQHAAAASPIEANLGQIGAGETRRIAITFHVVQAGQLCQEISVTADGGLRGNARSCITASGRAAIAPPATAPVIATPPDGAHSGANGLSQGSPTPAYPRPANPPPANPPPDIRPATPKAIPLAGSSRLDVRMTGPDHRKLGDDAQFVTTVTNTGDTPLKNVLVSYVPETSLEVKAAEEDFVRRGGALTWTIDSLESGQTKSFRVDCRCVKESTRACNRVTVTADGGTTGGNEACLEITSAAVAAPSAPSAPAVAASKLSIAVADNADPIRTGGETVYQIVVSNSGSGAAKQVALSVTVSPEMTITAIQASPPVSATKFPRSVRFAPLAEVRAGEAVTFELRVRGDRAGDGKLQVELTSDRDKTPVVADESTQILD